MAEENAAKSIICIGGPTGAGKSAAAAALGAALGRSGGTFAGGVVVNADSRQVYADFPIITAQPTPDDLALCPHELYGFLPCSEKMSAGRYLDLAATAIDRLWSENRVPILTGGTGLYFRSLLRGIANIPSISPQMHDKWQQLCNEKGSQALYDRLRQADPAYAAKIHPNDRQRVTRALEVYEGTGHPLSWWHEKKTENSGYRALYLGVGLELGELEPRLGQRIDLMLEAGAIPEAESAMRNCPDPDAPGWSGIGCAELRQYLQGETSLEECKALWFRNTRAYAKRQLTWFRAERDIRWFRPGAHDEIISLATTWLGKQRQDLSLRQ